MQLTIMQAESPEGQGLQPLRSPALHVESVVSQRRAPFQEMLQRELLPDQSTRTAVTSA